MSDSSSSTREQPIDLSAVNVVSTAWLDAHLGAPDLRVLDATVVLDIDTWQANPGRDDWLRAHIPGAGFIDHIEELSDAAANARLASGVRAYALPSAEQFAAAVGAHGIGPETNVVTYDTRGGMWAARLWWLLRLFGHERVAVLDGGFALWAAEQRPLESGATAAPVAQTFKPAFRSALLATQDEVLTVAEGGDGVLIHALSPAMFSGEERAALPRAGRIPGSVNVPFYEIYQQDGRLKSASELRDIFAAVGVDQRGVRTITYCGGGIAASSDALALAQIGVEAAVYDGSLVEWSANTSLPLQTG